MRLPHIIPFSKSPLYFFTVCTEGRRQILANQLALDLLTEIWRRSADTDDWQVGRFVLMPDHIHFFATPGSNAKLREQWIKRWKSISARRLMCELKLESPLWQKDTFDHLLRGVESYQGRWDYVRRNPVRAGLCVEVDDWAWQGAIVSLRYE